MLRRMYVATLDALMPVAFGRKRWTHMRHTDSCRHGRPGESVVERLAVEPTDIHEHLTTLHMLTRELRLDPVLELGTRTGESTIAFCSAAAAIGGRVVSADLSPCPQAERRVRDAGYDKLWTFHQGDDLALPWNEPIGHLFIDTSHEYEHTKKELAKFEPMVKRGGVITLHDYVGCPEVARAVEEHVRGRPDLRLYKYFNNHGLAVIFKS